MRQLSKSNTSQADTVCSPSICFMANRGPCPTRPNSTPYASGFTGRRPDDAGVGAVGWRRLKSAPRSAGSAARNERPSSGGLDRLGRPAPARECGKDAGNICISARGGRCAQQADKSTAPEGAVLAHNCSDIFYAALRRRLPNRPSPARAPPRIASDAGSGTAAARDVTEKVTLTPVGPWVVKM
jgi:hypothetical protein